MSIKYHKIPGPYKRQQEKPYNVIEGQWTSPELQHLANNDWYFTPKVDGTNIRIIWDGYNVSFGGRTDKAQLPPFLLERLEKLFGEKAEELFEQKFGETPVILFGEGYGPKINSGGNYRDSVDFILFDVLINEMFLLPADIQEIAEYFGIDCVPIVFRGTLLQAIEKVKFGLKSYWGDFWEEGLVGKPVAEFRDRRGKRIVVKVKHEDFYEGD